MMRGVKISCIQENIGLVEASLKVFRQPGLFQRFVRRMA